MTHHMRKWIIFVLLGGLLLATTGLSAQEQKSYELVVFPENQEWLVSLLSPVIAQVSSGHQQIPYLMALKTYPTISQIRLIRKLGASNCLAAGFGEFKVERLAIPGTKKIELSSQITEAASQLAQQFWSQSSQVVVAPEENITALLRAATLASHLRVPLIPITATKKSVFLEAMDALAVEEMLVVASQMRELPTWLQVHPIKKKLIRRQGWQRAMVRALERKKIRHLLLTRAMPENTPEFYDRSAWLTPYYSLLKQALPVFASTANAEKAEQLVEETIAKHRLRPDFLTILGNYGAIGVKTVSILSSIEEYEVEVEPCSLPQPDKAIALAVGRIVGSHFLDTVELIVRSLLRAREGPLKQAPVLMVANPSAEFGGLPLAETVSVATAEEFKNAKIEIHEFYRVASGEKAVIESAQKSSMIIFEGHASDQEIFRTPEEEVWARLEEGRISEEAANRLLANPDRLYQISGQWYPQLDGHPLVILQSCSSLEEELAKQIFRAGGTGFIGSVTSIHSASGSAFIKTVCDGMLYYDYSVGEALRFARNYFLTLAKLRVARGHQEIAKLLRVAYSFRLWGDPTLKFLPFNESKKRKAISAKFYPKTEAIRIKTPKNYLPKSHNEEYFTRMFPASQVAGLVKRLKKRPERRVMLLYFAQLKLPRDFPIGKFTGIYRDEKVLDTRARAAFLVDPFHKYLYVLYFPKKPEKKKSIRLKLSKEN